MAYLAQRQLRDAATAAANDAAGGGLDQARLRAGDGALAVDPAAAAEIATRAAAASLSGPVHLTSPPLVEVSGNQVTVTLEGEAGYVFSGALPGAAKQAHVRARATAQLVGSR